MAHPHKNKSNKNKNFNDGLINVTNALANKRTVTANNVISGNKISNSEENEIYKTGLGNKIVAIKTNTAYKEGLSFSSKQDQDIYNVRLKRQVKEASQWMLAFGRGVVTIIELDKKPSEPLSKDLNMNRVRIESFDGEVVSVTTSERNLMKPRFYKPDYYIINGENFHHSRVVDFTYVRPSFYDLSTYEYGGISEYELIYQQLLNDGVVEKASPSILEKNSVPFYKVQGFKDAMRSNNDANIIKYFSRLEDLRSVYGAGIIDQEDDFEMMNQTLTNLEEVDQITLRRLAMVTSIPLAILIGEGVKGLNSTGENEMDSFYMMIENLQENYLIDPINELMKKLGLGMVEFNQPEQLSPIEKATLEGIYLDNAAKLQALGEDYEPYLEAKGVEVQEDKFSLFSDEDIDNEED